MAREKKLIRQIEYGDRSALGELIETYYEDILRYCQWHTTDKAIAEDVAQETFLKAVRYLDANRFRGEFKSFLYKIARNTCIDLLRKRSDIYPREFGFYPEFTVQSYLEYVSALKGLSKSETKRKIGELLERLTLTEVKRSVSYQVV